MAKIEQPSRFMLTPTRVDDSVAPGRLRFQLWRPPPINMDRYSCYTVTAADYGRLDLVAYRTLGDPRLWWVIAHVNDIPNQFERLAVGRSLRIPTATAVAVALAQQDVEV